jgi:hypothetical protein
VATLSAAVTASSEHVQRPSQWHLDVEIRNDGPEPVRFSAATMLGSVAFEVADDAGRPFPLGPPPMPPADLRSSLVTLDPGSSTSLRFRGDELMPTPPPPGRYRVRFAATTPQVNDAWAGRIESPWIQFSSG